MPSLSAPGSALDRTVLGAVSPMPADRTAARAVALSVARRRLCEDLESWETVQALDDDIDPVDVQAELYKIADELEARRG